MLLPPPTKRVVYNSTVDHSVWVHCPVGAVFFWSAHGGLWGDRPRGFFDEQVRRQVASGIPERAAHAWINALQYGGKTEAETWGVIRDRTHNPTGYAHELMEFSELPGRWFRNAWVRGHNGGPPRVDLEKARPIQFKKIKGAVKLEKQRRDMDMTLHRKRLRIPWVTIESAIKHARDEHELRKVWPEGLSLTGS